MRYLSHLAQACPAKRHHRFCKLITSAAIVLSGQSDVIGDIGGIPLNSIGSLLLQTLYLCYLLTIVPSKLRNDRFFRRFVSDSFVNYEGHVCVPRDHNSLQAACEKLQVFYCPIRCVVFNLKFKTTHLIGQ
jgi:hypothetical protein